MVLTGNTSAVHRDAPKLTAFFMLLAAGLTLIWLTGIYPLSRTLFFIAGFTLTFTAMLGLRHYWPLRWGAAHILVIAVAARVCLLGLPASDDLNRYLWEGKCQLQGINPYLVAPLNSQTAPLRDHIWQGINHKEFTSIYGPVAQLVFKTATYIHYAPVTLKSIIVLFDIGTLLLLLVFLKSRKSRLAEALLYAVNPLVLYSFAGEGHVESIMLFMLAAAFVLHRHNRFGWMFIFLGSACFVKLTALIFVPLFIRRETIRFVPLVLVPMLFMLPYGVESLMSLITVTARFGTEFRFNGLFYSVFAMVMPNHMVLIACGLVFAGVYVWNIVLCPDPVKACGTIALAFLLTAPTAHAWYFTSIAMVMVLYPERSWIAITFTAGISWLVIFHYWLSGIWKTSAYFLAIEYAPPLLLGLIKRCGYPPFASPGYGPGASVSVVIPVLNEEARLAECLESINFPAHCTADIIVADGGSTDATAAVAMRDPRVTLIHTPKGRGIQIAEGVDHAAGDLILIVHADTRLMPDAIAQIERFCGRYPHVGGGCVAAKFNTRTVRFAFITALNNFRARFFGICFGDQVQFFRREALCGKLPRVKLMEDIEISLLLKERGAVAVLPALARSSTRRWEKRAYAGNMITVIALTALYVVRRRCGLLRNDNADFYRTYYGKA